MLAFLTIFAIGFLVLLLSFILGEIGEHGAELVHDVVVEHDVHFDNDGQVEHAHGGPGFFNIRIIAALVTGFGGAGAISVHYGCSYLWSSVIGLGSGFVVAGVVYSIIGVLYKQQASSNVSPQELVGAAGKLTIAIPKGGLGQVTVTLKGANVAWFAKTNDGKPLGCDQMVKVVKVVGDTAIVENV